MAVSPKKNARFERFIVPFIKAFCQDFSVLRSLIRQKNIPAPAFFRYNRFMELKLAIKQKALELGFDLVGITNADTIAGNDIRCFSNWLAAGYAAEMAYMHRNIEKRVNPAELLPDAKSVICLALNYRPKRRISPDQQKKNIANFALYQDYHPFIKQIARKLVTFIAKQVNDTKYRYKICVDSVPLAERSLAQRAGIGFIGKNHMLINPLLGSQLLLAEIVTTIELTPDKPIKTSCKNCRKCIKACPTGALGPDGTFDAAKCISYLTIEHKGPIPPKLAPSIGSSIFGCDRCILACPYEKAPSAYQCQNPDFKYYPQRANLDPKGIVNWTQETFDRMFGDSSVKRLGLDRLKRNAAICVQNADTQNEI